MCNIRFVSLFFSFFLFGCAPVFTHDSVSGTMVGIHEANATHCSASNERLQTSRNCMTDILNMPTNSPCVSFIIKYC